MSALDPIANQPIHPVLPTTSTESVTLLVHYYRGEIGRALSWRDRIDRTTNWAITVVAAMLSISFSTPTTHHGILIFSMALIMLILAIESRRYRFYDVYRNRLRRMERYYIAAAFASGAEINSEWSNIMADDLRNPHLSISFNQAVAHRLRRNYIWIFLVLLAAWLFKTAYLKVPSTAGDPGSVHTATQWVEGLALGPIPGGVVLVGVFTFYAWLTFAMFRHSRLTGEFASESIHV